MNLEQNTSFVLRYGSIIGVIVVAVGLLADLIGRSYGETIMLSGIAFIILTPLAALFISFATLSVNKEKKYAVAALALIAVIAAGMFIALYII